MGMEFTKRFGSWAQSAKALITMPNGGAYPSVLAPLRKLGLSKPFEPTAMAIKAYAAVIADNVAVIERLPSKYRKDVQEAVWNAVMKGYDSAGLARELNDRFGIVLERAQLIARTQCKMARAIIENVQRIELGITTAVWRYDAGRCTVAGHRAFSEKRYALARGANIDGKWVIPGSEAECFCSSTPIDAPDGDS
jgi:uncharacterized protein with gpF-like domain